MPQIHDTFNAPNIGVKVLVYGQAGMGKTVLCATAPQPIILSAERGLLSLRRVHVPYIIVETLAELKATRQWLMTAQAGQFLTVCLDSVSEIAEVILNDEKRRRSDPRQAYGEMAEVIMQEFREFRALPKHVVFTAKMGSNKDGLTGGIKYGPTFPGQVLDQNTPYLFDEMFQITEAKDPTNGQSFRVLRTQPDTQFEAKDRSGMLAPWDYPDLTYIFNKIMTVPV